jgi:hypothetical protein
MKTRFWASGCWTFAPIELRNMKPLGLASKKYHVLKKESSLFPHMIHQLSWRGGVISTPSNPFGALSFEGNLLISNTWVNDEVLRPQLLLNNTGGKWHYFILGKPEAFMARRHPFRWWMTLSIISIWASIHNMYKLIRVLASMSYKTTVIYCHNFFFVAL